MKTSTRYYWLAGLILIAAFGGFLRFYGLGWGLPWRYHVDENAFINAANAMRKAPMMNYLNPKWFYHPTLNIYLVSFLSGIYSLFFPLTLPAVHLLGRISSAFWSTLSLPLVFLLGRRLYGTLTGILAALFLSVTVIHIQMSHFFTPDVMLSFFLMATMYFSIGAMRSGKTRDYLGAGIAAGVGMASKYWILAVLPLLTVHLIRLISDRTTDWGEQKKLLLGLLAAGGAFFILSPYIILDAGTAFPAILWWAKKTTGEIPQVWAYHFQGTLPYLYHLTDNLPWAMGWPLAVLSLAGFLFCLFRRKKEDIVLVAWIVLNFLLIGSWFIKSIRYLLPIIPFLCVAAAALTAELISRRRLKIIGTATAAAAFLWGGVFSSAFISIYSAPHSKTQASEWVYDNIPPGSRLATDRSIPLGERNALPRLFPEEEFDFAYLFESDLGPEEKTAYLEGILERNDYVIIADELPIYFRNPEPEHLPEKEFLEQLFRGEKGFKLIEVFKEYPRLGGLTIKDDGAELSFHFFDHPGIFIFKKTGSDGVMQ